MQGFVGLNSQQRLLPFWFIVVCSGPLEHGLQAKGAAALLMKTKLLP